ncbi:hypothetical protein B7463_g8718, partial [Scytalidium lignicola]
MEVLSKRTALTVTTLSQLSSTNSTDDFIDTKIESILVDLAIDGKFRNHFDNAKKRKALIDERYNDAIKELKKKVGRKERELATLKRQEKAIADDMNDALSHYSTLEGAYSSVLMTKIISASGQQRKGGKFNQSEYAKAVLSYYNVERRLGPGYIRRYCHVTGWYLDKEVKCAHLVPKSLESDELAYLFGVREVVLSEPRNGITLHSVIEGGLDNGRVVLVPDKPKQGSEIVWRCVLVDHSVASQMIYQGTKWKDIDGRILKFLTPNWPARRYLYLRYVISYLHQQKLGNMKWLDNIKARGYLWVTPGPYLRKSMLLSLARRTSDQFLPEVFYESTFNAADGYPERSPKDEVDLAMVFDHKMEDAFAEKGQDSADSDNSDEEDSDDD